MTDADDKRSGGLSLSLADDESDWDARELCPDEACVGTIDESGHCRVCGETSPDGPREPSSRGDADEAPAQDEDPRAPEDVDDPGEDNDDSDTEDADDEALADDGLDDRELCPDGACIGTIGRDGKCRICKLPRGAEVD